MRKILRTIFVLALFVIVLMPNMAVANDKSKNEYVIPDAEVEFLTCIPDAEVTMIASKPKMAKKKVVKKKKSNVSEKDVNLLALLCMAEAEGESEKGKRLVIDTVLNRVDSKHFPNTISGVIYQKNQFTSMWNGRANRCHVDKKIRRLVKDEMKSRTNNQVMFFTAGRYGEYGAPMFRVGNHYFSKY